jgi:hypothetical protein
MRFSEREGLHSKKQAIQTNEMDVELRNSLWNVLDDMLWSRPNYLYVTNSYGRGRSVDIERFSRALWSDFFKQPADQRPTDGREILNVIRVYYFKAQWHEVYDFVEFVINFYSTNRPLVELMNRVLERELAGYRIIGHLIAPVTSQLEVEAVEQALGSPFQGSNKHIKQALAFLSSKPAPDYRNSIKESISAVESACKELAGDKKATLSSALRILSSQVHVHPALASAFEKLYGYTNEESGIRHAIFGESKVSADDAKFFLIICSAFVNLVKERASSTSKD